MDRWLTRWCRGWAVLVTAVAVAALDADVFAGLYGLPDGVTVPALYTTIAAGAAVIAVPHNRWVQAGFVVTTGVVFLGRAFEFLFVGLEGDVDLATAVLRTGVYSAVFYGTAFFAVATTRPGRRRVR